MSIQEPYRNDHTRPQSHVDSHHVQYRKTPAACFIETHTVTLEGIAPAVQAAVPQGKLAIVEGSEEPEVPDLVLAASTLPTTQSMLLGPLVTPTP